MTALRWMLPVVCLCVTSCGDGRERTAIPASAVAASEADLQALIAAQGSVTFRSYEGEWEGADSDTEITFLSRNEVHISEYGTSVGRYLGTYAIDSSGAVTLDMQDPHEAWRPMSLLRDERSLLLAPTEDWNAFVSGDRRPAYVPGQFARWPFRPVTLEEEHMIREHIQERRRAPGVPVLLGRYNGPATGLPHGPAWELQ